MTNLSELDWPSRKVWLDLGRSEADHPSLSGYIMGQSLVPKTPAAHKSKRA